MTESRLPGVAHRLAARLGIPVGDARAALAEALDELLVPEVGGAGHAPVPATAGRYAPRSGEGDERPIGYVRVPFLSKAKDAAPLRRVLTRTADQSGVSPYLAATLMTHVWQGVADELGRGNVVRVPGWGVYGPWMWTPKDGNPPVVYPRFVAARPFRQEVRDSCRVENAKNHVLRTFQRSHHPSSRRDQSATRTFTTMAAWRADIERQAGYPVRGAAWAGPVGGGAA